MTERRTEVLILKSGNNDVYNTSLAKLTASELTGRRWMFSRSGLSVTGGFIRLSTCFQSVEVVTLSRRLTVLSRSILPPLPAGVHWRRSYSRNRQMPKKEKAVSYWSSFFLLLPSLTSSHWCFYIYIYAKHKC